MTAPTITPVDPSTVCDIATGPGPITTSCVDLLTEQEMSPRHLCDACARWYVAAIHAHAGRPFAWHSVMAAKAQPLVAETVQQRVRCRTCRGTGTATFIGTAGISWPISPCPTCGGSGDAA